MPQIGLEEPDIVRKDDFMFTNYEVLICEVCQAEFIGRRACEGGMLMCPGCVRKMESSVINPGDEIPPEVIEEFQGGVGND